MIEKDVPGSEGFRQAFKAIANNDVSMALGCVFSSSSKVLIFLAFYHLSSSDAELRKKIFVPLAIKSQC